MINVLAIDFEFNRTAEPRVHPVCVSFREARVGIGEWEWVGETHEYWMDRTEEGEPLLPKVELARIALMEYLVYKDLPILAHGAAAEYRALHSMAMALRGQAEIPALCTYVLQRQLTHTYPPCKWGRKLKGGQLITTVPPTYIEGEEEPVKDGKPHDQVENSYVEVVAHYCGKVIDTDHKEVMRNKIISAPEVWEEHDAKFVQAYCTSDIEHLPAVAAGQLQRLHDATGQSEEWLLAAAFNHGRYMSCISDREDLGMPLDTESFFNLTMNADQAVDTAISALVSDQYPFYTRSKKVKGSLKRDWVRKAEKFNEYLLTKGLYEEWPKSDKSGIAKTDADTLKEYRFLPEIDALREVVKTKQNLGFFQAGHSGNMVGRIGSDNRMRTYPFPFGTQTGRDAPKPSTGFVLNMAKWIRWLVQAPEGKSILGCDWVSQEFILAGALSGDQNMIDIYNAGDVYINFGIRGGLIPEGATKKTHATERQTICKPVILGQQFGLGIEKQRLSLSAAQDRHVSWDESKALRDLHKDLFSDYWEYKQEKLDEYREYGCLIGPDGWCLLPGQDRALSVQNWPIQSMGGVLLRKANWIARGRMLDVFAGHHDALYAVVDSEKAEEWAHIMEDSMAEAVGHYLPDVEIRRDMKILPAGKGILEDDDKRVMAMFQKMERYFEPMESEDDYVKRILEEISTEKDLGLDMA